MVVSVEEDDGSGGNVKKSEVRCQTIALGLAPEHCFFAPAILVETKFHQSCEGLLA